MEVLVKFKDKEKLQKWFLESYDLFHKTVSSMKPDEEAQKAIDEVTDFY